MTTFSRLLLAAIGRLPIAIPRIYVPALRQVLDLPGQARSMFGEIFVRRIYEPVMPLPAHPTIVDLGGALGLFVIFINQKIRNGTILSFEASPRAFTHLTGNIARISTKNGNDIKTYNLAICDRTGEIDFLIDRTNDINVAATGFRDITKFLDYANFESIRVPCDRLDRYVLSRVDFLKCDIEGAEYLALDDGLLSPDRIGQMAVEFHDIGKHLAEFRRIVTTCFDRGYALYNRHNREIPNYEALAATFEDRDDQSMILKFCARALLPDGAGSRQDTPVAPR